MKYKLQNKENPALELVAFLEANKVDPSLSKDMALTIFWMFIQCNQDQLESAIKTLGGSDIDYEL